MKIWMIVRLAKTGTYETRRLKEEAAKQGLDFSIIRADQVEIVTDMSEHSGLFVNGKPTEFPDVLVSRFQMRHFTNAIARQIEQSNTVVLNKCQARINAKDKMAALQILKNRGLPIPKTVLAKSPLDVKFVMKHLDFPILIKKTHGSKGKGIVLCKDKDQLEDILEMMEDAPETSLILQEFVSDSYGKDIRVIVIGGRAIGAILRKGRDGDFKANFSGGGSVEPLELTPEIEWLAVEAANALDLEIAGVDLLFTKEGFKICEVNATPGFEGFEKATGINVPERIFKYISLRLPNQTSS